MAVRWLGPLHLGGCSYVSSLWVGLAKESTAVALPCSAVWLIQGNQMYGAAAAAAARLSSNSRPPLLSHLGHQDFATVIATSC